MSEEPTRNDRFITYLRSRLDDRGFLADLRRGFSEATADRAWPHIAPWCNLTKERERTIFQTVGAAFATQPDTAEQGNMGHVMHRIAVGDGSVQDGLATFDSRFRRFLSCTSAQQVCARLPGIIRTAATKNIPINHSQLLNDLWYWNERTRIEWAAAYWKTEREEVHE
jgi:CRISPR type I-E-associated protein CasB/Cse2